MAMRQAQVDLFDRVQRLVNGGKTGGGEALLKAQATSQTESTAKALLSGRKKNTISMKRFTHRVKKPHVTVA